MDKTTERENSASARQLSDTCLSPLRHGATRCARPRAGMAVAPQAAGYATHPWEGGFHESAAAADAAPDIARDRPLHRVRDNPCSREFVFRPLRWHRDDRLCQSIRSRFHGGAPRESGGILEQHPTDRRLCWHVTVSGVILNIPALVIGGYQQELSISAPVRGSFRLGAKLSPQIFGTAAF